jgi:hypothetical protein
MKEGLTRDDILDNITLYWLTDTGVSSARLYWENKLPFFAPKRVGIPVAVSVFPDDICPAPKSWAEKAYPKLVFFNKHDRGGHFATWEQPQLLSEDMRAGFRSLHKPGEGDGEPRPPDRHCRTHRVGMTQAGKPSRDRRAWPRCREKLFARRAALVRRAFRLRRHQRKQKLSRG